MYEHLSKILKYQDPLKYGKRGMEQLTCIKHLETWKYNKLLILLICINSFILNILTRIASTHHAIPYLRKVLIISYYW